jgi:hypothetical protein
MTRRAGCRSPGSPRATRAEMATAENARTIGLLEEAGAQVG